MARTKQKSDDPGNLPLKRLQQMAAAGEEILEIYRVLEKAGSNVVAEVLRHQGTFYQWNHYPPGDSVDWETHSQYYFHAHPQDQRGGEHGHFHCFMRYDGIAAGARPTKLETPQADNEDRIGCHLVAISMDKAGFPVGLFTTNRWVTDETWYGAPDVIAMLDNFLIDHTHPSWATNRWLSAMFRLFGADMKALVEDRDATVAARVKDQPDGDVFEDRGLEITSHRAISVKGKIAAVHHALKEKRAV
ncbi:MAG: hypothetical protein IID51_14475 [Proteobacteria bacterium]|nr:hypothetical protein [Pseudomonadota bacterium]